MVREADGAVKREGAQAVGSVQARVARGCVRAAPAGLHPIKLFVGRHPKLVKFDTSA
jgi:hypothetical protein